MERHVAFVATARADLAACRERRGACVAVLDDAIWNDSTRRVEFTAGRSLSWRPNLR